MIAASLIILVGLFVATIRVTRVATRIEITQRELARQLPALRAIAELVPEHVHRLDRLDDTVARLSRSVSGTAHHIVPEADDAS